MKSKEDGMNMAVFALWTADFRTAGNIWLHVGRIQ
jgi:hypothetical protein